MRIRCERINGKKYEGKLIELDSNVLHCRQDDGTPFATEVGGCEVLVDGEWRVVHWNNEGKVSA